jgi:hypothetical protein
MSRLLLALILVTGFSGPVSAEEKPPEDLWNLVRFMEGSWVGKASGRFGLATVERTYSFVLDGTYLHEQNTSTYPPQEKNPSGEVHDHWSFFSLDRGRGTLVLRQLHDEGIVNQFVLRLDLTTENTIVFESEAIENFQEGWRAREIYRLASDDEFVEEFQLAPPEKDFQVFIETHFERSD